MNAIPLVARNADDAFARLGAQSITIAEFCADVEAVAGQLPDSRYVVNLCRDRYTFAVSFFAVIARGQTNLLPGRRDRQVAQDLQQSYARCVVIGDTADDGIDLQVQFRPGSNGTAPSPSCAAVHTAAIAFTSGSTGTPQAHAKTWQMLDIWRHVHQRYLPGAGSQPRGLVATVPSWHMYGLEWAMLLPTIAPLTLHCGADFYPQDVAAALGAFDGPAVLVSTPVHLRALRNLTRTPDNIDLVISATAPLDAALTAAIEEKFHTRIFEIYGCSEIGSLASRMPATDPGWTFFDCFEITFNDGIVVVDHPALTMPVPLADHFRQLDTEHFSLEGRSSDIVKIGGKRESLANLNNLLTCIPGVEDGIIYDPAAFGLPDNGRLAALVVAPGLDGNQIRQAFARTVDAAFVPRSVRMIHALPRDNTSKLRHAELARLIKAG